MCKRKLRCFNTAQFINNYMLLNGFLFIFFWLYVGQEKAALLQKKFHASRSESGSGSKSVSESDPDLDPDFDPKHGSGPGHWPRPLPWPPIGSGPQPDLGHRLVFRLQPRLDLDLDLDSDPYLNADPNSHLDSDPYLDSDVDQVCDPDSNQLQLYVREKLLQEDLLFTLYMCCLQCFMYISFTK